MRVVVGMLTSTLLCTAWAQDVVEPDRPLKLLQLHQSSFRVARAQDFLEMANGDLVLTANSGDSVVIRLHADGTERWSTPLPQQAIIATTVLSDGSLVLAGSGPAVDGSDFATTMIWMDSDGHEQRRRVVGGGAPANLSGYCNCDSAYGIVATSDGGHLLIGASTHKPGGPKQSPSYGELDGWVVKVDSQGQREWDRSYGGSRYDVLLRGAKLSDQGFILAGFSISPADGSRTVSSPQNAYTFWLIRTDANGQLIWEKALEESASDGMLTEFLVAQNGDFVLSGQHGLLLRTTSNGEVLWERRFGGIDGGMLRELPDGRLLQASMVQSYHGGTWFPPRTVVRCLSAGGDPLWEKSIANAGGSNSEVAGLLASDGSYWFATRGQENLAIARLAPEFLPTAGTQLTVRDMPEFLPSHPNGRFSVNGPSSTTFVWESSVDLNTWAPISTNKLEGHSLSFSGGAGEGSARQFFRARTIQ